MYRNAYWHPREKVIKLRTWAKDGTRMTVDCAFRPYLYIENANGSDRSIFGTPLIRKEFNSVFDRTKFVDDFGNKRLFYNFGTEQQFLMDVFWKKSEEQDFGKNPLRILFFDIEVDEIPGGEFPEADEAKAEINILTVYDTLLQRYKVFSKNDYTGNNLDDNVDFILCENEGVLLHKFIQFWCSYDYPDIVTAWNLNSFDMPYVLNRIKKVLGEDRCKQLSPYDYIRSYESEDKIGRKVTLYSIAGVTVLDMIDVYAKFKITKQESYKLDFIANLELGIGKVDYDGMTIYEFMRKEWNRFVEYNVRDVELLVKIEEKTRYFKILRMICNKTCCNYDKGITTIPITNGGIVHYAKKRGEIVHTFVREKVKEKKPGGFVSSNYGLFHSVVTFDASSLYPSIAISLNISPETKVGMLYTDNLYSIFEAPDDHICRFVATNGKEQRVTKRDFFRALDSRGYSIAGNGCVFNQEREGIFTAYLSGIFKQRQQVKKQIRKNNERIQELEKELEQMEKKR